MAFGLGRGFPPLGIFVGGDLGQISPLPSLPPLEKYLLPKFFFEKSRGNPHLHTYTPPRLLTSPPPHLHTSTPPHPNGVDDQLLLETPREVRHRLQIRPKTKTSLDFFSDNNSPRVVSGSFSANNVFFLRHFQRYKFAARQKVDIISHEIAQLSRHMGNL